MKFIKENKNVFAGLLVLAAFIFVGESALASIPKNIELNLDNSVQAYETSSNTVEEFLLDNGFSMDSIEVEEDLDTKIKNNLVINVNTNKNIEFTNQGNVLNVTTFTNTVADFLAENNINVDEDDIVYPNLEDSLEDGHVVTYDNVVVENYEVEEDIPFAEIKEYSFDHELGYEEVTTEGRNGKQIVSMVRTIVNGEEVSDLRDNVNVDLEPVDQVTLLGSKEVVEETVKAEVIENTNDSMFKDQTTVVQEGVDGLVKKTFENKGEDNRTLVEEETLRETVDRIIEVGTKTRPAAQYSLSDFQFHGVIRWSGYKFTYYSQSVLPGGGLRIPGRHVNSAGFVADNNGYIVLASNYSVPMGSIINTPFGAQGKVYDRCASCSLEWYDVYTR